jgi:hypothetical protein
VRSAVLCSAIGNQGDVDEWDLQVDPAGDWAVALTYGGSPNRDMALLDTGGVVLARADAVGVPDSFRFDFVVGTDYRLRIAQTEGGSGDPYTVVISQ